MEKNAKIFVAGHRGMVGSAIVRELKRQGYTNIITRTHAELDLLRQVDVENFFEAGLAIDLFMVARQRQQHRRGILCRRACQLDRSLAAGEHHVNDLLGGFAVSYVDGESPPMHGRVFATILSHVGIFPVQPHPAA